MPRVDVVDREHEVMVRAELPGVERDALEVSTTNDSVTIKGTTRHEEKQEEGEYVRCETVSGSFARTVSLPCEVDDAKAKARFKDGLLELTLPKAERARRRAIQIE